MNGGWWGQIKFGLFFGIGFILAIGVLKLALWLINMIASGAAHSSPLTFP